MNEPHVSERLKELRNRSRLSVREMAKKLGYEERYSTYSSYENKFKKNFLPVNLVKQLVDILVDRGDPPITAAEVWGLSGVMPGEEGIRESIRRAERTEHSMQPEPGTVVIPEYDVSPQAGGGAFVDPNEAGDGEGHPVLATWSLPKPFVDNYLPDHGRGSLSIIRVAGNSMEPDFAAGDRVLVDTSHRVPSPDGVYVLWNGMGIVIKQLMMVPKSEPPKVRIISVNPTYPTDEVLASDLTINGRVVGKWVWK